MLCVPQLGIGMDTSKTSDPGGCVPPSVTAEPTSIPVEQSVGEDEAEGSIIDGMFRSYWLNSSEREDPNRFDP